MGKTIRNGVLWSRFFLKCKLMWDYVIGIAVKSKFDNVDDWSFDFSTSETDREQIISNE